MLFESLFEGSFRFADVTGFTVVTCHVGTLHHIRPGDGPCI